MGEGGRMKERSRGKEGGELEKGEWRRGNEGKEEEIQWKSSNDRHLWQLSVVSTTTQINYSSLIHLPHTPVFKLTLANKKSL